MSIKKEDKEMICQECTEEDARLIDLLSENEYLETKIANFEGRERINDS